MQLLSKHFWYSLQEKLSHSETQLGIKVYAGVFRMSLAFTNCQKFRCKQGSMKRFLVITFFRYHEKFDLSSQKLPFWVEGGIKKVVVCVFETRNFSIFVVAVANGVIVWSRVKSMKFNCLVCSVSKVFWC